MKEQSRKRLKSVAMGTGITLLAVTGFVLCIELAYVFIIKPKTISTRREQPFLSKMHTFRLLFMGQSDINKGLIPGEFDPDTFN